MLFKFPQFIEVEDKLFGPFTFKQFVYMAGSVGLIVVCFTFLPKLIAIPLAIPIAGFGLALTFLKPNNRPFMFTVESFVKYAMKEKLYVWRKAERSGVAKAGQESAAPMVPLPKLSDSKLKNISWSLDVKKGGEGTDTEA